MSAPNPSHHRLAESAGIDDLDERIRQAESDLIARDQRVRHQVASLGHRVRRARRPARWAAPIVGGVALLAGAWWLWRHRHSRSQPAASRHGLSSHSAPSRSGRRGSGMGLLQLLAFAWPLLPTHWRERWGPTSTSAMFNMGASLVKRVLGASAGPASSRSGEHAAAPGQEASTWPPLRCAAHVDLGRYAGSWHEIARLPTAFEASCAGQPQASYVLREDGFEVINRCPSPDGRVRVAQGEAKPLNGSGGAKLKVSFMPAWLRWLPVGWSDYWILFVDEGYTVALVGEPNRRYLWLLARRPRIERDTLHELVGMARAQGFPVERLVLSQPA
jgi:apolipoprotein D and lipocalin family protein